MPLPPTAMPASALLPAQSPQRRWRWALLGTVLGWALAACGGGGPAAEPVFAAPPQMSGVISDGLDPAPRDLEVQAKGQTGLSRTAVNYQSGTDYRLVLTDLGGPYLLGAPRADGQWLYALATEAGTANLTPLSSLVATQALAADLDALFEALGQNGGVPAVTAAQLAQAQAAVSQHLWRRLGLDWRHSPSFTTTPFQAKAGDPHFDRLQSLQAALAAQGSDLQSLLAEVRLQALRCQQTRLQVQAAAGGDPQAFCPDTASTRLDPVDTSVREQQFTDLFGDRLLVRSRGEQLLSVQWDSLGASARCSAADCTGLSLGPLLASGERRLSLSGLRLSDASGTVTVLDGELTAAALGLNFPPLACERNRVYLVPASGDIVGFCDEADGETSTVARASGALREVYNINDASGSVATQLEVSTEGQTVVQVLLWAEVDGVARVSHRCLGAQCLGVSVSALGADGRRSLVLADTSLAAVDGNGQPSGEAGITVRADFQVEDEVVDYETYCGFNNGEIRGRFSDETAALRLCVPTLAFEDETGFYGLVQEGSDGPGLAHYRVTSMEGRYRRGEFSGGVADRLRVDTRDGQVQSVLFTRRDGQTLRCDGAACSGVSIRPASGSQGALVQLAGTRLTEVLRGGLGGDRSLVLNGSFSTPVP